jgi:hypothetical protein
LTTFITPSGSPASRHSAAIAIVALGSFSLGLSTTALPHAIATGTNHNGTIAGKLNGLMTATTPRLCRIEYTSTLVEAFSVNPPLSRCGIPHANSATSSPRMTSPSASLRTLPCSAVISAAIFSRSRLSSSRNLNSTWVRLAREALPHSSRHAFRAVATTSETRSAEARSRSPVCAPVAGL